MSKITQFIQKTIAKEGGYVDHPDDKGGATKYGITEAVAKDWGFHGPMSELTEEIAHSIYFHSYWIKPGFYDLNDYSELVAWEVFDTGVLCGTGTGIRFLQQALSAFNQSGSLYPDLRDDCVLGSKTLSALGAYLEHRGPTGEVVLLKALNCLQGAYFLKLAELREQNESFVYGWINHRVEL